MSIADAIRRAREKLGWSQSELARRIGVSKTAVSRWEDGSAAPNRNRVAAVARALGVAPESLSPHTPLTLSSVDLNSTGHMIPVMEFSMFAEYGGSVPSAVLSTLPTLLADVDNTQSSVALRIEDDPLPGLVSRNDIVIVSFLVQPITGDLVIALTGDVVLLRQYQHRGQDSSGQPCFDLVSTNLDLPTRTVNSTNPGKILGVIVEVRKRRR